MDRSEISAIVEKAIDRFVEEQSALLDLDVTERALSHYLAIYLAALVPGTFRRSQTPLAPHEKSVGSRASSNHGLSRHYCASAHHG